MRLVLFLITLSPLILNAQPLLPIPSVPSRPTLPLIVETNPYYVFSWPTSTQYSPQKINPTNIPYEVRYGVTKILKTYDGVNQFIKTNGEVILFGTQTGGAFAGTSISRIQLPAFCQSNIVCLYSPFEPAANGYTQLILSSNGQLGVLYSDTPSYLTSGLSLSLPNAASNIVGVFPGTYRDSQFGYFISLFEDGTIKVFTISGGDLIQQNHPANNLIDVKTVVGNPKNGMAICGNGAVHGWVYNSYSNSVEILTVPEIANTGIVQITLNAQYTSPINNYFYALKNDGSIIYWDSGGQVLPLPESFSGKQFVKIVGGFESGTAFALTKEGKLLGWQNNAGILNEINLGFADTFKFISIDGRINEFGRGALVALDENNGLKVIKKYESAMMGSPVGWAFDNSVPTSISKWKGSLNSFLALDSPAGSAFNYSLSTDSDLAVETYLGFPLDLLAQLVAEKIRNTPSNFGISTESNMQNILNVTVSNLATKTELNTSLSQSRTDGINSVLSNPNLWTLYTTNQIKTMAIGDLVLNRTNNGEFVLNYDIEQSEDLVNWSPYQGFAMPLTNLPTNKAFVRIKAKQ